MNEVDLRLMDYAAARANMIECQVRTNKVIDTSVIAAMATVPREAFVPEALRPVAYIDEDLTVAPGRFLLEPMIIARLLQFAEIKKTDRALDFATGTGYGAALLAQLAGSVTALDSRASLLDLARRALVAAPVPVSFVEAPLDGVLAQAEGLNGQSFDVILVSGALPKVPTALFDLLAEGGRLVTVLKPDVAGGGEAPMGSATLFVKRGGITAGRTLFDSATPLLPEFAPKPQFVF